MTIPPLHPLPLTAGFAAGWMCFRPLKRMFDNRVRRMRENGHTEGTKPGEGITLQPGESAQLEFDVPPEIAAALEAGCKVEVSQGEDRDVGGGYYERDLVVFVDGKRKGCFRLRWRNVPN